MRQATQRRSPRWCYRHEGALYVSQPMRIGKTDWRLVVHQTERYGVCTDYQWRRYDDEPWYAADSWPTYNGNDTYGGLPKTLRTLWERERAAIEKAKGGAE